MKQILCLLLVLFTPTVINGATSFSPINTEQVYGKTVKFCEHNGLRMLPKSVFKDYNTCAKCTCTKSGLHCATMSKAFKINVPDDSKCVSVLIGCKNRWRLRNNPTRRCPKPLIPTDNITITGK